jgi:hypothetical protein
MLTLQYLNFKLLLFFLFLKLYLKKRDEIPLIFHKRILEFPEHENMKGSLRVGGGTSKIPLCKITTLKLLST